MITEATGATTPMRPIASPLYSAAMPKAPVMPATAPQTNDERGGMRSPVSPSQSQHQKQAAGVRSGDHAKDAGALGGDAAGEVASAPDARGAQTERRGRDMLPEFMLD